MRRGESFSIIRQYRERDDTEVYTREVYMQENNTSTPILGVDVDDYLPSLSHASQLFLSEEGTSLGRIVVYDTCRIML